MKTKKNLLYALPFVLFAACNNAGTDSKDSVEVADSVNETRQEKADSAGTYQADTETTDFLVKAANCGMAEIKLGELAKEKGTNPKVKGMGELMASDHHKVADEVKNLASKRNVTLPATIGDDKQKDIDDISAKTGKDFDKAYVRYMIKEHEKDIDLFKRANDKVNDADVRTFANNTLPKLQAHLDSFKVVQKIIN